MNAIDRISVLITAYKNADLVRRCVDSLLQVLAVSLVFAPLSAAWYGKTALANRRPDIAWAYLKGTVRGLLGLR